MIAPPASSVAQSRMTRKSRGLTAAGVWSRNRKMMTLGASLRQHMLFTDMSDYPSWTQVFARFEYVWGW